MIKIVILGAGNVAHHLYKNLQKNKETNIIQCYNRKGIPLQYGQTQIPVITELHKLSEADIYILAVSDDAVAEITEQLPFKNRLVVHTSGSVPLISMSTMNRRGVFYPLQTFSATKDVNFEEIPICLETERKEDYALLETLACSLSNKIYPISSYQRSILHVAAVFVNNFVNHMFTLGDEICAENKVPFEILHPLVLETAKKILAIEPKKAQTGPAMRKDEKTINRHLDILQKESQKELYTILTKSIQKKYGKEL